MRHRPLAMLGAAAIAAATALVFGVAHTQAALGILAKYAPTQTGTTAKLDQVSGARDVAVSGGLAFVVDAGHGRIAVYNTTTGKYVRQIGTKGSGQGQLQLPVGIAIVNDTGQKQALVVVSDYNGDKIVEYRAADGAFVREFGTRGSKPGELDQPSAITADANGTIYVADYGNDRIQSFSLGGAALAKADDPEKAGSYGSVVYLAADGNGTLWATYSTAGTVGILQLDGSSLAVLQNTKLKLGSGKGQIRETIGGIAVIRDVATRARTVYVADSEGYRILRFAVGPTPGAVPVATDSWPAKGDAAFTYKPELVELGGGLFHVLGVTPAYAFSVWGPKAGAPATTTAKPATTAATFAGTWSTNFGTLTVTLSGAAATGTYTHDSGKITATVSGTTMTGTWSEAPTYAGPKDAGPFTLTLAADGKSFKGTWRYADDTTSANQPSWNGTRVT